MGDANSKKKQNEPHQNITKSTCKVHAIDQPPNQRPVKNHQPQQNVRLIKTTAQENTSNNHPGLIIQVLINKIQQIQLIPTIIPPKIIPSNSSVPPRNQPKDPPRNHPNHPRQSRHWMAARPATPAPITSTLAGSTLPAAVNCPAQKRPKWWLASGASPVKSWEQDLRGDLIRGENWKKTPG